MSSISKLPNELKIKVFLHLLDTAVGIDKLITLLTLRLVSKQMQALIDNTQMFWKPYWASQNTSHNLSYFEQVSNKVQALHSPCIKNAKKDLEDFKKDMRNGGAKALDSSGNIEELRLLSQLANASLGHAAFLSKEALQDAQTAYLIFNCPQLRDVLLDPYYNFYSNAADAHESVALFLLQDSTCRKSILDRARFYDSDKQPFLKLAEKHLSIARLICNEDVQLQKLILENTEIGLKIRDMMCLLSGTEKEQRYLAIAQNKQFKNVLLKNYAEFEEHCTFSPTLWESTLSLSHS